MLCKYWFLLVVFSIMPLCIAAKPYSQKIQPVKNLIILVPDGCGTAHMSIARWFRPDKQLAQDRMNAGLVTTYSANSLITGSAAAATAFATGFKSWEDKLRARCLALAPDTLYLNHVNQPYKTHPWQPVATLLEAAILSGRATGIVANCALSHATPAAFSSHWHERDDDLPVIEQQVYLNLDCILAGGYNSLLPSGVSSGTRKDGDNLVEVIKSRNYRFISTEKELDSLPANVSKVWGAFAPVHLSYEIDRKYTSPHQPSLAYRTAKAIEILSRNKKKGFVLIIEGSEVDWASHNNDPVGVISEYLAFDDAVKVAVDSANRLGNTEVLVFPDHDNGGMSLGRRGDDYTSTKLEPLHAMIGKCKMSCGKLYDSLVSISQKDGPLTYKTVGEFIEKELMIDDLRNTDELFNIVESINNVAHKGVRKGDKDVALIGEIISRRCNIGWTTYGHTGNMVPFYSLILQNKGTFNNTDITRYCEVILGLDLKKSTDALFIAADSIFPSREFTLVLDTAQISSGTGVLTVKKDTIAVQFPFNKDIAIQLNDTIRMSGRTIYSKLSNVVYLPKTAKDLFSIPKDGKKK
ncbi:MAG TPA: alkaline phosphatase [Chitinispirillaceae bacterium]|nr:alkaline phosphatase [Chitinispirillaceae bacterium]